jgi:hypothetical protein
MNKTYLTIGGVAVASLAAGVAGGYFIAKKKFDDELSEVLAFEVDKARMHYEGLMEDLKNKQARIGLGASDETLFWGRGKYESEKDYQARLDENNKIDDETEDEEDEGPGPQGPEEHELTEDDHKAIAKGRHHLAEAQTALVNYQGISTQTKPPLSEVVESHNIFTSKKPMPPRGENGKFRRKTIREATNDPPQILDDPEEFLLNELEYDQVNLLYFINDNKTLVQETNITEAEDINRVGEVNLTLFPNVPEGEPSVIYVRNEGLKIYYQVTKMTESLTERIGLGEYAGDDEGLADDGRSFYES